MKLENFKMIILCLCLPLKALASWGVFALILLTANIANAKDAESASVKVAVLGSESQLGKELDMLTAALSEDKKLSVLSRSEWTKLIREYEILKQDTASAYSKFGNISGADALIILKKETLKKKPYLIIKLVDTKTGVVLDALAIPESSLSSKEEDVLKGTADYFRGKLAKLANSENLHTVSLLNIRAETDEPELLAIEKEINAALSYRLKKQNNVLLTERDNMPEVLFEKYLNHGDESEFRTGESIIDGRFNLEKNNIKLLIRVRTSNGKSLKKTYSLPKDKIAEMTDKIADFALKTITGKKVNTSNQDRKKEAQSYFKEAQWAYNAGLYDVAAKAAEAAYTLGIRHPHLVRLRIKCYAGKIVPSLMDPYASIYSGNLDASEKCPPVDISDEYINSAIIAMDIGVRYAIIPGEKADKKRKFPFNMAYNDAIEKAIKAASAVLWSYEVKNCRNKDVTKRNVLKALIRRTMNLRMSHKWHLYGYGKLAAEYIPLWYDNIEDMKEAYKRLLITSVWDAGRGCTSGLLYNLSHREYFSKVPFFINWKQKFTEEEYRNEVRKFINELASSSNPQLHLAGLGMKIGNDNIFSDEETTEIPKIYNQYLWKNRELFYQGKMWCCNRFFGYEFKIKLIEGYLDYLLTNPDARQGERIYDALEYGGFKINFTKIPKNRLRSLFQKILKWEKTSPQQFIASPDLHDMDNFEYIKDKILGIMPELASEDYNLFQLKKIWTPYKEDGILDGDYTNFMHVVIENERIYKFFPSEKPYDYPSFIYILDKNLSLKEEKRIKTPYSPWCSTNFNVQGDYIYIAGNDCMFVYNVKTDRLNSIKTYGMQPYKCTRMKKQLYFTYSKGKERGLAVMDMDGGNLKIIASSRRRPPENKIDGAASYNHLRSLDSEHLWFDVQWDPEWPWGAPVYIMTEKEIKPMKKMPASFFEKYLKGIYCCTKNSGPTSYVLFFKGEKTHSTSYECGDIKWLPKDIRQKFPVIKVPVKDIWQRFETKDGKIVILSVNGGNLMLFNKKHPEGAVIKYSSIKAEVETVKELQSKYGEKAKKLKPGVENTSLNGIIDDTLIFSNNLPAVFSVKLSEIADFADKISKKDE